MSILPRPHLSARRVRASLCALVATVFGPPALAAALTIGVTPTGLALPVDIARTQGFFAAEGVEVRVVDCSSGPICMKRLFDRSLDIAGMTELPVVMASFERNDFAVLATMSTSIGNIRVVGRKSAGVTRPQDLIGKRIGAIAGSSTHYYLDAYLLFHGIDPQQIKFVPVLTETAVKAIEQGQVDALSSDHRHTGPAMKALGADLVMLDDARIYTTTFNLVAEKRTVSAHRPEIVKVLRAIERAERFINDNPERAKELLMSRLSMDRALADRVFATLTYRLGLDQSLLGTMAGQARWATREGYVDAGAKRPNFLDLVDYGPLRAAVPSALPK